MSRPVQPLLLFAPLVGRHLLKALARLSLDKPADNLKHSNGNDNQCHNANNNYQCNIHIIDPLVFQSHPSRGELVSRQFRLCIL